MRERGILFSEPMVLALLAGKKTQTRRMVGGDVVFGPKEYYRSPAGKAWRQDFFPLETAANGALKFCPYGVPGDRLWVRETWAAEELDRERKRIGIQYKATPAPKCRSGHYVDRPSDFELKRPVHGAIGNEDGCWRPGIHMFRWAARLVLEITEVRVQRLQEISKTDALAEGVPLNIPVELCSDPVAEFRELWDLINEDRCPWTSNPWLWCVSFKLVESSKAAA
jgi:hypothetical protein